MCNDMLTSEKFKAQAALTQMRANDAITQLGKSKEANVPKASDCMMKFSQAHSSTTQQQNDTQSSASIQGDPYEVTSTIAYEGHRLSSDDQD